MSVKTPRKLDGPYHLMAGALSNRAVVRSNLLENRAPEAEAIVTSLRLWTEIIHEAAPYLADDVTEHLVRLLNGAGSRLQALAQRTKPEYVQVAMTELEAIHAQFDNWAQYAPQLAGALMLARNQHLPHSLSDAIEVQIQPLRVEIRDRLKELVEAKASLETHAQVEMAKVRETVATEIVRGMSEVTAAARQADEQNAAEFATAFSRLGAQSAEMNVILEEIKKTAQGSSLKHAQTEFQTAMKTYAKLAKWAVAGLVVTAAAAGAAIWWLLEHVPGTTWDVQNVYVATIRILVLALVIGSAIQMFRLLRTFLHLWSTNAHRMRLSNSVLTFGAAFSDPRRAEVIDRFLAEVVKHDDTGLLGGKDAGGVSHDQLIEAMRTVIEKAG